ncbi:hypothetical protein BJF91_18590 [Allorhizobium taibaishanense]|uniref:Uncharacterized protein n=1 Tax=Allorhizobium taibaishanense TaxID=887144 RepID=A0A1Q9A3C4_9HYPH|nr:hypothetical protein BJF91_18590 [Allorhizobium taibaishanense]
MLPIFAGLSCCRPFLLFIDLLAIGCDMLLSWLIRGLFFALISVHLGLALHGALPSHLSLHYSAIDRGGIGLCAKASLGL